MFTLRRCISTLALLLGLAATLAALPAQAQTIFLVTNTNDTGAGSFRQAMLDANASHNTHIHFNIDAATDSGCDSTTGVCTIQPQSALPGVNAGYTIDGTTQPGASCGSNVGAHSLKIVLDGSQAGNSTALNAITVANFSVRGLVINNFGGSGIVLSTTLTTAVECNYIGTDVTGTIAQGNGLGLFLRFGSGTVIQNNLISGNRTGLVFDGKKTTIVRGNYVGTDASGTAPLGNIESGLFFLRGANSNTIGGLAPTDANTIAYNGRSGIHIDGDNTPNDNNAFLGNRIFSNGTGGISLGGVADNDPGDADAGPNRAQNYPQIASATLTPGGNLDLIYLVDTDPANAAYPLRIEFFLADANGQGQRLIGSDSYTATAYSGCGTAPCPKLLTVTPAGGPLAETDQIVATATDANGNTSQFTQTPVLLPVELVAFTARADGPAVELAWQTASETNNAGFEVEHYEVAAQQWQKLGFVEGYGTTERPQHYRYRVAALETDRHRFRLRQVDYDGSFEYSPEVVVAVALPEAFVLTAAYPNPFNPETRLSLSVKRGQHVEVAAYDMLGRQVARLFTGEMEAEQSRAVVFEAGGLPSGVYMIRAVGETFVASQRVTLVR